MYLTRDPEHAHYLSIDTVVRVMNRLSVCYTSAAILGRLFGRLYLRSQQESFSSFLLLSPDRLYWQLILLRRLSRCVTEAVVGFLTTISRSLT